MQQINQIDKDNKMHGYWEIKYGDVLYSRGNFIHGKQHGYWELFHSTGLHMFKGTYDHGRYAGLIENFTFKNEPINCDFYARD